MTNQAHMENLAHPNLATTNQVSSLLATITKLQNKVWTLSPNRQRTVPCSEGERNNGGSGRGGRGQQFNIELLYSDKNCTYYWSHGGSISANHNSTNCKYKKQVHIDADTFANRHDGITFCFKTWYEGYPWKKLSTSKIV